MLLRQGYQQRGDALATKQHRHGNTQTATHLMFPCFQQRLRATDFLECSQATFIKKGTVIGQALATRCALKQAYSQPRFKASNAFPYRRARQMQTHRGLSKTACLYGGDKNGNILQRIGHGLSFFRNQ